MVMGVGVAVMTKVVDDLRSGPAISLSSTRWCMDPVTGKSYVALPNTECKDGEDGFTIERKIRE
jgi:hypothetical protein